MIGNGSLCRPPMAFVKNTLALDAPVCSVPVTTPLAGAPTANSMPFTPFECWSTSVSVPASVMRSLVTVNFAPVQMLAHVAVFPSAAVAASFDSLRLSERVAMSLLSSTRNILVKNCVSPIAQ